MRCIRPRRLKSCDVMKLGKLLGLGKSFFGGSCEVAYRLNKIGLPKFNDGQNPFATKAPEEKKTEAPAAPELEKKAVVPVTRVAPPTAKLFAPTPQPKPALAGWTAKLNPFRAPEPPVKPVAVQAELSLDAVKVMHNDLTDAEVDIVPVKSHGQPVAAPVLPPARHAWEFLGENVLKSS